MVIYLSWFTSDEIGEKQTKIIQKKLGITPFTWKSYATKFKKEEAEIFQKSISQIKKKKWPFEYTIIPDIEARDIAKYYLDPKEMFGYKKCVAPFMMVDIMPNGDVTTCRDFIDVKVGNINEKPILDIWNDKDFVRFRWTASSLFKVLRLDGVLIFWPFYELYSYFSFFILSSIRIIW